jgi:hypothetical protein
MHQIPPLEVKKISPALKSHRKSPRKRFVKTKSGVKTIFSRLKRPLVGFAKTICGKLHAMGKLGITLKLSREIDLNMKTESR